MSKINTLVEIFIVYSSNECTQAKWMDGCRPNSGLCNHCQLHLQEDRVVIRSWKTLPTFTGFDFNITDPTFFVLPIPNPNIQSLAANIGAEVASE